MDGLPHAKAEMERKSMIQFYATRITVWWGIDFAQSACLVLGLTQI